MEELLPHAKVLRRCHMWKSREVVSNVEQFIKAATFGEEHRGAGACGGVYKGKVEEYFKQLPMIKENI